MVSKWFSALVVTASLLSPTFALWPQPTNLQAGTQALKLSPGFSIDLAVKNAPRDLVNAVQRTRKYIEEDDLERLVVGRGSADEKALQSAKTLKKLRIELTGKATSIASEAVKKIGTKNEAYTLEIPADGSDAVLKAETTLGLSHGLNTFSQLWYVNGRTTYTVTAPLKISDAPAYVSYQFS
jgi:hexosaminidase